MIFGVVVQLGGYSDFVCYHFHHILPDQGQLSFGAPFGPGMSVPVLGPEFGIIETDARSEHLGPHDSTEIEGVWVGPGDRSEGYGTAIVQWLLWQEHPTIPFWLHASLYDPQQGGPQEHRDLAHFYLKCGMRPGLEDSPLSSRFFRIEGNRTRRKRSFEPHTVYKTYHSEFPRNLRTIRSAPKRKAAVYIEQFLVGAV